MASSSKRSWKLQEFVAHNANVNCLALGHKSGRVLATGGDDKKVNLWAVGKPNCIMGLTGHATPIECVQFNNTEELVCAGSQTGALKIWDLEAAKLIKSLTGHKSGINALNFHPYGDFLASGSHDSFIKLWDPRRKGCIQTLIGHRHSVNSLKFSPDGQWIASCGEDTTVKVWDLRQGRMLHEFTDHSNSVTSVEFHPHDFLLASGGLDRTVNIWDLENFQLVATEKDVGVVKCLWFNPDGECLFTGVTDGLRVIGWEPSRVYDSVPVGWGKVFDIASAQHQLVGATFHLTNIIIHIVDTKKIRPFCGLAIDLNNSSPFSIGQSLRKSFSKERPINLRSKSKLDVKTIEESTSGTDPEEDISADITNIKDYAEIFQPNRSLQRTPPPIEPFKEPVESDADPAEPQVITVPEDDYTTYTLHHLSMNDNSSPPRIRYSPPQYKKSSLPPSLPLPLPLPLPLARSSPPDSYSSPPPSFLSESEFSSTITLTPPPPPPLLPTPTLISTSPPPSITMTVVTTTTTGTTTTTTTTTTGTTFIPSRSSPPRTANHPKTSTPYERSQSNLEHVFRSRHKQQTTDTGAVVVTSTNNRLRTTASIKQAIKDGTEKINHININNNNNLNNNNHNNNNNNNNGIKHSSSEVNLNTNHSGSTSGIAKTVIRSRKNSLSNISGNFAKANNRNSSNPNLSRIQNLAVTTSKNNADSDYKQRIDLLKPNLRYNNVDESVFRKPDPPKPLRHDDYLSYKHTEPINIHITERRILPEPPVPGPSPKERIIPDYERNAYVPTPSDRPIGLDLEAFLPDTLRSTSYKNYRYEEETDDELLENLLKDHNSTITLLAGRVRAFRMSYQHFRNSPDSKTAVERVVNMKDIAVVHDVLNVLTNRQSFWSLDMCVLILPKVHELVQSRLELHIKTGCEAIRMTLRNFASLIRSNMLSPCSGYSVDIPREERYQKCRKCYDALMDIRMTLGGKQNFTGELGATFKELFADLNQLCIENHS